MEIKKLILEQLKKQGKIKASDIMKQTGFSRVYVNRFFRQLIDEGKIILIGKANKAHYILAGAAQTIQDGREPARIHRMLRNVDLREDIVFSEIKAESRIFQNLPRNISDIVAYGFTEMLNNAIEHSRSQIIDVVMSKENDRITFDVSDRGIGIFNNIMEKKGLRSPLEAIQDLLKGKQTTAPALHSGEGIFFTSKLADRFTIRSFGKKLIFDNTIQEIAVKDMKRPVKGTKVFFAIGLAEKKELVSVFHQYSNDNFAFSKTSVKVKLFREGVEYVSRSQARRILVGLEKFKTIELDFTDVETIGQGFADEIFRVWQSLNPGIRIVPVNAHENVTFMIKYVRAS